MPSALYATNVFHYDHVLAAMSSVFDEIGLLRRFEISQKSIAQMNKMRIPQQAVDLLARRVREQSEIPSLVRDLGPAQIVLPILARSGLNIRPMHTKWVTSAYARRVAAASKDYDVLHFVEGLGFRALDKHQFSYSICERRNFHHSVFEQQLETLEGFPSNGRPDPLAKILEFEYEASDYILVYSNAAKKSFTDRGYSPEKVLVAPIAVSEQLPRIQVERDPYRLIYVGRGDVHKGIDVAVAAVRLLGGPYRLTVAGPMSPAVRNWLSTKDHVDYVGILNRRQLRQLYSSTAAMVLPSTESFGLAAAEAVHHGLPLICSEMTGIAEYLPPEAKTVVPGRDAATWAREISRVLSCTSRTTTADDLLGHLDGSNAAASLQMIFSSLRAQHLN